MSSRESAALGVKALLAVAFLLLLGGCGNSSAREPDRAPQIQVESTTTLSTPEQVVQRIEPVPPSAKSAPSTGSVAASPVAASPVAASPVAASPTAAAGVTGAAAHGVDGKRAVQAGTITVKHIEDELNRLEAELK